ncbi:hypothetical protein CT2148 [Chlorobaculum tepidum TLS]|uniref:Uncharacterized protein n=1 Tax=Chlorobaculum tepidum (strain ATCC 49652 / DSM 12025 / NBRC 103806 / TLS) TaxID=194439 RepID=Q8K5F6_CHLTE|nr:hypothetical protein CT0143 [Chlorobaculum tepidum TLS]AAM73364.1 hypothetical protein CT2148 [Chlorobaculum tepidum TLS]
MYNFFRILQNLFSDFFHLLGGHHFSQGKTLASTSIAQFPTISKVK